MEFIKTKDPKAGANTLLERIQKELRDGNKVLWLLSGGSAINSEVEIIKSLKQSGQTDNLTIMLMDERYGPVGHPDSNWQQLLNAGADFGGLQAISVLSEHMGTLEETAVVFAKQLASAMEAADITIGLFGLGPDGHTAGILPGSPATVETGQVVVSYKTPQFDRITPTRPALLKIGVGYVFAFGDSKLPALTRLQANQESFAQLPAKLLWDLPEVYVYNDQVGEAA